MRRVTAATFVTLDGVMQAPGGPDEDPTGGFAHGGWTVPYWDEPMNQVMGRILDAPYDLLLGRKTYEIFAAYWPYAGDDPIGKKFNAVTKHVATSSREPLTWKNSVAIHGDAADGVARLKQEEGPDLLIQGSSQLIQALLAKDLIDEITLLVFPLVLGSGKRLFGSGTVPAALKLVDSKVSTTGVTMGTYRRGGPVTTGSFAQEQPSDAEMARRRRMQQEG